MLRGAVIGFGRMGLTHFAILNNHPKVKFVAVCDSSSVMLKNVMKYTGIETFSDYKKMIDKMDLAFVLISTPTAAHAETVKYALKKNVHVFVEKPFTLNVEQGHDVLDALDGRRLINQVGYVIRFNDVMIHVKKLLESLAIGELLSFKMEMYAPTVLKDAKSGWRSKKTEGGGCLYDFASHGVDLINYLIGFPEQVKGSVMQNIYSSTVEDAVSSTFFYKNNLSGMLMVNWSDPSFRKPSYRMEIFGRKGKIVADLHAYKAFFKDKPETEGFSKGWNMRYITDFAEPVRFYVRGYEFTRQLDYFIDCILNKTTDNICSFAAGLATDRVIEMIIKDAGERSI